MSKDLNFEEIWKETKELGLDIKGFAEELLKELSKTNIPLPVQKLLIQALSELHYTNEWFIEEFTTDEQFNNFKKQIFLNHDHLNHEVVIRAKKRE